MKRFLLLALLLPSALSLRGQSPEEFDELGREVYLIFSDTSHYSPLQYIRVKNALALIDQQNWSNRRKSDAKRRVNANYAKDFERFRIQMGQLVADYNDLIAEGYQIDFLGFEYELKEGRVNQYTGTLYCLLKGHEVRTVFQLRFEFFYSGYGFGFLNPVEEVY